VPVQVQSAISSFLFSKGKKFKEKKRNVKMIIEKIGILKLDKNFFIKPPKKFLGNFRICINFCSYTYQILPILKL